jgi:hypothetical protein
MIYVWPIFGSAKSVLYTAGGLLSSNAIVFSSSASQTKQK